MVIVRHVHDKSVSTVDIREMVENKLSISVWWPNIDVLLDNFALEISILTLLPTEEEFITVMNPNRVLFECCVH